MSPANRGYGGMPKPPRKDTPAAAGPPKAVIEAWVQQPNNSSRSTSADRLQYEYGEWIGDAQPPTMNRFEERRTPVVVYSNRHHHGYQNGGGRQHHQGCYVEWRRDSEGTFGHSLTFTIRN